MTRLCVVDACGRKQKARGYCATHLSRLYARGSVDEPQGTRPGEAKKWLEEHANYSGDECLVWPYSRTAYGYAQINYNRLPQPAHRVMCRLAHGEPKFAKADVAHSCGKGHEGCINPRHLRWATRSENQLDRRIHGTSQVCRKPKLSPEAVIEIRSGRHSTSALAKMFGVSGPTISAAKTGRTWKQTAPGISPEPHKTKWAD